MVKKGNCSSGVVDLCALVGGVQLKNALLIIFGEKCNIVRKFEQSVNLAK